MDLMSFIYWLYFLKFIRSLCWRYFCDISVSPYHQRITVLCSASVFHLDNITSWMKWVMLVWGRGLEGCYKKRLFPFLPHVAFSQNALPKRVQLLTVFLLVKSSVWIELPPSTSTANITYERMNMWATCLMTTVWRLWWKLWKHCSSIK